MNTSYYLVVLLISVGLSQTLFTGIRKEKLFPLATWNLYAHLPIEKEISTLYFEDKSTGKLCYFYLCPRVDRSKITAYHPYHIVRWRKESMDVADYFKSKLDLEKLNYRIHIKTEQTTMVKKWQEISQEIK